MVTSHKQKPERTRHRLAMLLIVLVTALLAGSTVVAADEPAYGIRGPESLYLSGQVPFFLEIDPGLQERIASVIWYLDGRQVHRSRKPPYCVTFDLGPAVLPHRIVAAAFSDDATELWTGEHRTLGLSVAFSDRVSLVVVPVTVLHPEGYFHTGLTRKHFRIYEDHVRQELVCFANDVVPLSIALVIDTSKSMRGKMREIRRAARTLIDRLSSEDLATVMSFNDDLVRHCGFTGDKPLLHKTLKDFRPGGGTALFDAIYGAARAFRESEGKRVIILFTDGQDQKYRRPAEIRRRQERAVSAAARENITVYTIGLGRDVDGEMLTKIADTTGGAYFHLGDIKDLAGAYSRIFEELGSQYTLCYRPETGAVAPGEASWRSIQVEVEDQSLMVRHKKGYSPSR